LLRFHSFAHLVRDVFELFEEDVVRAVHDDFGEASDRSTLNILALCLFNQAESKFLEMSLEQL
jgi:hypothetical protein